MRIDFKQIGIANLIFCYLPVVLFVCGWCRWEIGVPVCILLGLLFYFVYRDYLRERAKEELVLSRGMVISLILGTLGLSVLLGYGGLFASFNDYEKHSMVVQDLSRYSWPVIYSDASSPSLLTYYVGSYLFPALVGKIFGSRIVAEIGLGLIGWMGMILLFLNILFLTDAQSQKKQIWAIVIYLGFYGMLLPLQLLMFKINDDVILGYPHWFTYKWLQYRSSMASLKWVWEQYTIPALCLAMLYRFRSYKSLYAVWILPALICGTWGFVALFGFAIGDFIISCIREKKIYWEILSWQNILCGMIGVLMVIYLAGSLATDKPEELKFHIITDWKYYLVSYLPFCLFMFGFYYMLIWKGVKRDSFFYVTLVLLCLIPLGRAGLFNDWCMGTSMPALFMLTIYCIRYLLNKPTEKEAKKRWVAMIVCMSLSVPFAAYELYNPFHYSGMPARSLAQYSCEGCEEIDVDLRTNYFCYQYEESLFYKYIARK